MRKLLVILGIFAGFFFAGTQSFASDIEPGSITMTPANPATNTDVTICFRIRGNPARVAVAFAPDGATGNCTVGNRLLNWVLADNEVYKGGNMTVGGVPYATTSVDYTSVYGTHTGDNLGNLASYTTVCFDTHIPPEFSGDYELLVIPDSGLALQQYVENGGCAFCQGVGTIRSTGFSVSGERLLKLDLEVCNARGSGSCPTGAICLEYKVTNWGESGYRLTGMAFRFCYYDIGDLTWEAQGSSNAQVYTPAGGVYCNNYAPANQFEFEVFDTVDCGQDGKTNQCYVYQLSGGSESDSSMPYYIPPNGGYLQGLDPPLFFRPNPAPPTTPVIDDDYANLINIPDCGVGWSSDVKMGLFDNGEALCEWNSNETEDPDTGVPHCGATSGCDVCATSGNVSNKGRTDFGFSNAVCLDVISPTPTPTPTFTFTFSPTNTPTPAGTPTPMMELTKSASVSSATIGDVITFYIEWNNDSSGTVNMQIWDTVPGALTYGGCGNVSGNYTSCSESGGLVSWNVGNTGANTTGQVYFYGTVSGYPWWPLWQKQFAVRPRGLDGEWILGSDTLRWWSGRKVSLNWPTADLNGKKALTP